MRREDLALYLVTDRGLSMGRDLETVVLQAVEGGVTLVQLREKDIGKGRNISTTFTNFIMFKSKNNAIEVNI